MKSVVSLDAVIGGPASARGLPYPSVSLKKALERADTIAPTIRPHSTIALSEAGRLWGYRPKSSGIALTASALKQFGLATDEGSRESRVLRLTPLYYGIRGEPKDESGIKKAALTPRVLRERFARWSFSRPVDETSIADLRAAYGYSDAAAHAFVKVFDETVAFARLAEQDHASVLAELPAGTRRYVLKAEPGHYVVNPGSGPITVTVPAAGQSSGRLEDATLHATAVVLWPTKRFTYQTDEGEAALELPTRISRRTQTDLIGWFLTLVNQAASREAEVAAEEEPKSQKT